jgi:hypothetical protein
MNMRPSGTYRQLRWPQRKDRRVLLGCLICAALMVSSPTSGQVRKPDLNGTWSPARYAAAKANSPDPVLVRKLSSTAILMRNPPPPIFEFPRGDFGGLKLQPAALKSAMQWRPEIEASSDLACSPSSVLQAMNSPFAFEIHQATELIVIKLEYFDLVRIIFMDGRPHPGASFPKSKVGHSLGHWEDDVLVVDTTHIAPSVITSNGLHHSEHIHLIERFRLEPAGGSLHWTQEFEDPAVLAVAGARYARFDRRDSSFSLYDCDPAYASFIQNRER